MENPTSLGKSGSVMSPVGEIGNVGSAIMTELQGAQEAEYHTVLILRRVYLIIWFSQD